MNLSLLGGSCSVGLILAAGNILVPGSSNAMGQIGNVVNITNANISGALLTTVMSVDVPAGEQLLIKKLSMGGLTTTSADLAIEIEIDGLIVGAATVTATAEPIITILGNTSTGTQQSVTNVLQDILVRENFKLRARKTPATAASAALTYVKLIRG